MLQTVDRGRCGPERTLSFDRPRSFTSFFLDETAAKARQLWSGCVVADTRFRPNQFYRLGVLDDERHWQLPPKLGAVQR
jgi:hypothetical protein